MTEFERELLKVLRELKIKDSASELRAIKKRIIEVEKLVHERVDKLESKIKRMEKKQGRM